jgi:hypothetical protein
MTATTDMRGLVPISAFFRPIGFYIVSRACLCWSLAPDTSGHISCPLHGSVKK